MKRRPTLDRIDRRLDEADEMIRALSDGTLATVPVLERAKARVAELLEAAALVRARQRAVADALAEIGINVTSWSVACTGSSVWKLIGK